MRGVTMLDVCQIALTQGKFSLVDREDWLRFGQRKWYAMRRQGGKFVAGRMGWYAGQPKRRRALYLHREIMRPPPGLEVDHISGDTLDNQRANLRVCTRRENSQNLFSQQGSSQFRGVSWNKPQQKWNARTTHEGARLHLGTYAAEIAAALAFDRFARAHHGEFARVNFPRPGEHSAARQNNT